MSHKLIAAALGGLATLAALPAFAQPADPAIDARVRQAQDRAFDAGDPDAALVTGSGDLILLAPRKLFEARLDVSPTWTSNAQLTPTGGREDTFVTVNAVIGVSTRIADRVNVHAEGGLLANRYRRDDSLDYDAATADIGADVGWKTPLGNLTLAASYLPSAIYEKGFGERRLTQHRVLAAAQLVTPIPIKVRPMALVSTITVDRTWADPEDYNNQGAAFDAALVVAVARGWRVQVGGGVYRRKYESYFPGLVGVDREDNGSRVAAQVTWMPKPYLDLSLRYGRTDNHSTSDVNPYLFEDGGLTLRLSKRF